MKPPLTSTLALTHSVCVFVESPSVFLCLRVLVLASEDCLGLVAHLSGYK